MSSGYERYINKVIIIIIFWRHVTNLVKCPSQFKREKPWERGWHVTCYFPGSSLAAIFKTDKTMGTRLWLLSFSTPELFCARHAKSEAKASGSRMDCSYLDVASVFVAFSTRSSICPNLRSAKMLARLHQRRPRFYVSRIQNMFQEFPGKAHFRFHEANLIRIWTTQMNKSTSVVSDAELNSRSTAVPNTVSVSA